MQNAGIEKEGKSMRTMDKKGRLKEIRELRLKNFLVLTLAGIVNSFGVSLFLFPVKLYDSGISGLSMLLDQITPSQFTMSLFLLLLKSEGGTCMVSIRCCIYTTKIMASSKH